MCRMLVVKSKKSFLIKPHLEAFAQICENSCEYQGHGWGMIYSCQGKWKLYKHIDPIWKHNFLGFNKTDFLMVHARSAFLDQGIVVENNMPFESKDYGFMFNGELHGVRIKTEGRIGAEKIFNFLLRMNKNQDSMGGALKRGIEVIRKRTAFIRGMNIILVHKRTRTIYLSSEFHKDPDYFTMKIKQNEGKMVICSEVYPGESGWRDIPNYSIEVFK